MNKYNGLVGGVPWGINGFEIVPPSAETKEGDPVMTTAGERYTIEGKPMFWANPGPTWPCHMTDEPRLTKHELQRIGEYERTPEFQRLLDRRQQAIKQAIENAPDGQIIRVEEIGPRTYKPALRSSRRRGVSCFVRFRRSSGGWDTRP